jgi:RimJ/RimL family protein N-acetyltransferase
VRRRRESASYRPVDDGRFPPLTLRTAGLNDYVRGLAAAADDEAQRWLGWDAANLTRALEARATALLNRKGDAGKPVAWGPGVVQLAALTDGGYAGSLSLYRSSDDPDSWSHGPPGWQVGLVLAPDRRRQGLGARLFRASAEIARHDLGAPTIWAGCDAANEACRRALLRAEFKPCAGPSTHRLPNGQLIATMWFGHD